MPRESALAYHGIWRDYSQPRHHELVWTLTTPQLLCVLALLAALLAFAQQRWWVITRYLLIKILHPIRLADSDKTSIDNLTQGRALKALLFKQNTTVVSISPWFGTVSLFNFLLFLAIGATLPHFLTGGGPGPARVVSQATSDCRGFLEFSPNVVEAAEGSYAQCLLAHSTNGTESCRLASDIVEMAPALDAQLKPTRCQFNTTNCLMNKMPPHLQKGFKDDPRVGQWENLATTLRLEHHSMRASDVGLNVDRRIWQRHQLTCSPLKINRYEVPYIDDTNATVLWVGYEEGSYDASETFGNVIPAHCLSTNDYITRCRYDADGFLQRSWYPDGPWEVQSRRLYELAIYPALADGPQQMQFVNLHPGLNASNGDTFVTILRHGMELLPGVSSMYQPGLETPFEKPSFRWGQPMDYAVGCIEAYSLCYDHSCTQWLGIERALETVKYHLGLEYGNNTASELTPIYKLMVQASSLRNVLAYHHHSTLVLRYLLQQVPGLERALSQMPQWQWEVRAWFDLSILMFKLNLMASIKGETRGPEKPSPSYNGTEWICEKLLFQDDHVTNLDIFGLSIALCSLMTIYLLSYLRELFAFAARSSSVARLCRRLGFVGRSTTALLLLAQRFPLAFSSMKTRRSSVARRDIGFANEIPSSNSIDLEHVARSNESRQEPSSL